jgi:16S rRNA (cytosine1402-N4)-methyltransferase
VARAGGDPQPKRMAPIFQALRIWTNDEMTDLDAALSWLPDAMRGGGVVVTLAYHSGEDRRVKHAMRGAARTVPSRRLPERESEHAPEGPWEELTRRVVVPTESEQVSKPRARSARLRAYRRKSR